LDDHSSLRRIMKREEIFKFLHKIGGKIILGAIDKTDSEFGNP